MTNNLVDVIDTKISERGYSLWSRDTTIFYYAFTTARQRDPSRGLREILIDSNMSIEKKRSELRAVYDTLISYNEVFDPLNYFEWLTGLVAIYTRYD